VRIQPTFVLERVSAHLFGEAKARSTTTVSADVRVMECPSAQIADVRLDVGGARCSRKIGPLWVKEGEATRLTFSVEGSWITGGVLSVAGVDDGGIGVQGSAMLPTASEGRRMKGR